ncbi:NUDIX hydrolase [Algoriphagus namhaensis]|uniref:NUDIX hydrolase n=1 Tax=Algoriphagus namhaensis TaxID=915353 RepID=A0ABV8ARY6_9BACT
MSKFLRELVEKCVPGVSLDCVVLGYQNNVLKVLLLKYKEHNAWALPGGFLPQGQEMEEVIGLVLKERTGLDGVYLEQFKTYSSINRGWNCNEISQEGFNKLRSTWSTADRTVLDQWFNQRFISTAYFALINCNKAEPTPDAVSEECAWVPVNELPNLVLDHKKMISEALSQLKRQINFLPIGKELLDQKFTMLDLQRLYESILDQKLDRGNFQRKMMKLGILTRHEKLMTGAQNKAPYLYSIDLKVYDQLIKTGISFV